MNGRDMIWKGRRRSDPERPRPLADAVLRLIWQERRVSRADIARIAELSRSTVTEIVAELLPTGLISEIGAGKSRGGRRPIVLEFQDEACVILGVEMGAAHVAVALTDLRGRVLVWESRPHPVRTDPDGTRRLITELCRVCLDASPLGARPLAGIGVAVPCPVDHQDSDTLSKIVMPDWEGCVGLEDLAAFHGVPLIVENDANCGALAEQWWGVGAGVDDFAYIKVATGIGSGHVIGGEIYRGASGVAGEIGHMAIDPHGGPCICGLRGCLVTKVGARALTARAAELSAADTKHPRCGQAWNIVDIENGALGGDAIAEAVVLEAAEYLGIAVAGLLNLMNPSLVVIGGDLARLGDILLTPLRRTVASRTLITSVAAMKILASELGPRSVAIGAATGVLKTMLASSRLFPALAGSESFPARDLGA